MPSRNDDPRASGTPSDARPSPSEGPSPIEGFRKLVGELIEHVPSAMFALDGAGRVLEANARFESLIGTTRHDFLGLPFVERLVVERSRESCQRSLALVRSGESDSLFVSVQTAHGSTLALECDVRRYGRAATSPWLVTVVKSQVERSVEDARPYDAKAYTVVRGAQSGFVFDDGPHAGSPCHVALYGYVAPCAACPVARAITTGAVAESAWVDATMDATILVRAQPMGAKFRCERVILSSKSVDEIVRARVEARIDQAGLSSRERDVLEHLRLGRTLEHVAVSLGISHHTVKFHTANILQKLGADSRLDLIRILS